MIDRAASFPDDETGAVENRRLVLIGGMMLIAGMLAYQLFGASIAARFSAADPGVESFRAEVGITAREVATR